MKPRPEHRPLSRRPRRIAASVLALLALALPLAASAKEPVIQGAWSFIEVPKVQGSGGMHDMAFDEEGTLWLLGAGGLRFWNGQELDEHPGAKRRRPRSLFGGADRGLYVLMDAEKGDKDMTVARVKGPSVEPLADYFKGSYDRSEIEVAASGQLFRFSPDYYVEALSGNGWRRFDVHTPEHMSRIRHLTLGHQVFLVCQERLYRWNGDDLIEEVSSPAWKEFASKDTSHVVEGAMWGEFRGLFCNTSEPGLLALDMRTLEPVELGPAFERFAGKDMWGILGLGGGSLLMWSDLGWHLLRPDGSLQELPYALRYAVDNDRPESFHLDASGNLWAGLKDGGVAIVSPDGRAEKLGWEEGLVSGPLFILEQPGTGHVWCGMRERLARFEPGGAPPKQSASPDLSSVWETWEMPVGGTFWPLSTGEMALFRADHPGKLARYDGAEWTFQELPFELGDDWARGASDDKGRLALVLTRSRKAFIIGPDSAEGAPSLSEALLSMLESGAKDIRPDKTYTVAVLDGGRLAVGRDQGLTFHDDKGWKSHRFRDGGLGLHRSKRWNALASLGTGQLYEIQPGGELKDLGRQSDHGPRFLLGRGGMQPYEPELLAERPGEYVRYYKSGGDARLYFDDESFAAATSYDKAGLRVRYMGFDTRVTPAPSGGFWMLDDDGDAARLFGRTVMPWESRGTPLSERRIWFLEEDAAGNIWFQSTVRGGATSSEAIVYRAAAEPGASFFGDKPPAQAERTFHPRLVLNPRLAPERVYLFARVDGGEWKHCGKADDPQPIEFESLGQHECELAFFDSGVRLKGPAPFRVEVVERVAQAAKAASVSGSGSPASAGSEFPVKMAIIGLVALVVAILAGIMLFRR